MKKALATSSSSFTTGNAIVDQIGKIHITGNVIPHTWYQWIRYTNKRGNYPDTLAILILADIVYWYRPFKVRDSHTGHTTGWKKKFTHDSLQRSPTYYSELYGVSPKQARESLKLLESLGLIKIKLTSLKTPFGVIPTTMFVTPDPDEIAKISNKQSANSSTEGNYSDYQAFLNSGYWQEVRKLVLERDNHTCQECGSQSSLHVHHLTYEHHGDELNHPEDLVVLCKTCHADAHGINGDG